MALFVIVTVHVKTMDNNKPYGHITREDIKKAVDYVFNQKPKPDPNKRVIRFAAYCRGLDTVVWFGADSKGPPFCEHLECLICRGYEKALKEEIENWKPEVWYGEKRGEHDHYLNVKPIKPKYPLVPTEIIAWETQENLSAKEIIEKYGDLLSKEQLEQLKKYE